MKAWAHIFRRAALAAGLVGLSALSGCATYYDSYYDDRYSYRDEGRGDYYVGRSYGSSYGYGYDRGYYGPNSYYDSVLWPTRRYYDPWFSPFGYGYPRSSIGFSLGYYDPFWYPAPYRHGHWHRGWSGRGRHDRRDLDRGQWRPGGNEDPYRRDEHRFGRAGDEPARVLDRRGADRPISPYIDPDRDRRRDGSREQPDFSAQPPRDQPRFPAPEPRDQPRFSAPAPREQPRFSAPEPREQPRFEAPSVSSGDWSRGRDQDSEREPE